MSLFMSSQVRWFRVQGFSAASLLPSAGLRQVVGSQPRIRWHRAGELPTVLLRAEVHASEKCQTQPGSS